MRAGRLDRLGRLLHRRLKQAVRGITQQRRRRRVRFLVAEPATALKRVLDDDQFVHLGTLRTLSSMANRSLGSAGDRSYALGNWTSSRNGEISSKSSPVAIGTVVSGEQRKNRGLCQSFWRIVLMASPLPRPYATPQPIA